MADLVLEQLLHESLLRESLVHDRGHDRGHDRVHGRVHGRGRDHDCGGHESPKNIVVKIPIKQAITD